MYGLQTPGMVKVGCPALALEARSNLPQLAWVGPTEKQPALTVSLQQFRGQPAKALSSEHTRGQFEKEKAALAVPVAQGEQHPPQAPQPSGKQPPLAFKPGGVQLPLCWAEPPQPPAASFRPTRPSEVEAPQS